MADDLLVLLVEAVHRSPGESDMAPQLARIVGRLSVLPCATGGASVTNNDGEPGDGTQLAVLTRAVLSDEDTGSDIGGREERDRVEAWLVEQEHVLAVCYPLTSEHDSQPSAKGLSEQESFREQLGSEEPPQRRTTQRALLPR